MLILKYYLTEEEYFDYNYFTSWASPDKKKYRIRYYIRVLILYAAVAGLYIFSNRNHFLLVNFIIFGVIALIYFLLVPTLIRMSVHKRVRDILAEPDNKHILDEAEITLTDTGITDKDNASESKYSWEAIVRKAETPACYYLYTNSYHAIVIPKRAVSNAQDRQELQR